MPQFPIAQHSALFACPHCGGAFSPNGQKSLACAQGHSYDLAKSGYINLLSRPIQTEYDKTMLSARRRVAESGFFDTLLATVATLLPPNGYLLDAGCGEGSHLAFLRSTMEPNSFGVGLDLSKEGILLASKAYRKEGWVVGDLAQLPFQDACFDGIVNILSPTNYGEFARILKKSGRLIKVIPNAEYLIQLRRMLLPEDSPAYSNEQVLELFYKAYPAGKQQSLRYNFSVTPSLLADLIPMTPLSWGASPEGLLRAQTSDLSEITLDFTILQGE